jgi:hypothetical protein
MNLGAVLDRAVGWIAPVRLYVTLAAFALLIAAVAVQTVRLEGFKVWPVSIEGWKPKAKRYEATIEQVRIAQDVAAEKARLARLEQEARYRALAERIDDDAQRDNRVAVDAAERFIAAGGYRCTGGVRPQANRGAGGGTGASAEGDRPVDPERAGGAPELDGTEVVGVTADDVRICTVNTIKAEAAKAWAEGVE